MLQRQSICLSIYLSIDPFRISNYTDTQSWKTIMAVSVRSTLCLLVYCKQNARPFWEYSLTRPPSWGRHFGRQNLLTDVHSWYLKIQSFMKTTENWSVLYIKHVFLIEVELDVAWHTVENKQSKTVQLVNNQNYLHVPLWGSHKEVKMQSSH